MIPFKTSLKREGILFGQSQVRTGLAFCPTLPMEVDLPQGVEELMEVDPSRPEQTWDYRSASLLSAI